MNSYNLCEYISVIFVNRFMLKIIILIHKVKLEMKILKKKISLHNFYFCHQILNDINDNLNNRKDTVSNR